VPDVQVDTAKQAVGLLLRDKTAVPRFWSA